ncbi:MAG TPA: hypothetical protein VHA52_06865 [Candidatus Babeliaceae bacterium]|nr:hypothetical protein [Candidatus Babeliaceae bacterium]
MAGLYWEAVRTGCETQFVDINTHMQKGRGNNPALKALQASLLPNDRSQQLGR